MHNILFFIEKIKKSLWEICVLPILLVFHADNLLFPKNIKYKDFTQILRESYSLNLSLIQLVCSIVLDKNYLFMHV